ncbi:hypothetical protein GCM10023144_22570 [Pigmentiphaga soli]|uniref:LysR substrate-binding domain-containing protein n=2 Tax=Pigmentiphaga soli TaxID=1007095 RepID=A0ABP8H149_9BURK
MAVAALVGEGIGVALLPDWAPMWSGDLGIVRVPLPNRAPVRRVGVVWDDGGPRASLAQRILADARREFCGAGARAQAGRRRPPRAVNRS